MRIYEDTWKTTLAAKSCFYVKQFLLQLRQNEEAISMIVKLKQSIKYSLKTPTTKSFSTANSFISITLRESSQTWTKAQLQLRGNVHLKRSILEIIPKERVPSCCQRRWVFFKGGRKGARKKRRKRKKLKERNRMPERDYGLSSWWSRSFSVPSGVRAQDRKPVLHPREGGEGRSHTGSHSGYQLILSRRLETFKSET